MVEMVPHNACLRWLAMLGWVSGVLAGCLNVNNPPSLAFVQDQNISLSQGLQLSLIALDPDGDELLFSATGLPAEPQFVPLPSEDGTTQVDMIWHPVANDTSAGGHDYHVVVRVEDPDGKSAERGFMLTVTPDYGVPVFDLPGGVPINLANASYLALPIPVKDDDSISVDITMEDGPEGSKIKQLELKEAYFYWKPTMAQRLDAVHSVVFKAQDETHAPVFHTLTVVLVNAEPGAACSGSPPSILHTVPQDANATSGGTIPIEVTAMDQQSAIHSVQVHWDFNPNMENANALSLVRVEETPDLGRWTGEITPAQIPGAGGLIHYFFKVTDNDDPTGVACDRTTRYPKQGQLTLATYPFGANTETCVDDGLEPDNSLELATPVDPGFQVGRRLCGDDRDTFRVMLEEETTLTARLHHEASHGSPELTIRNGSDAIIGPSHDMGDIRQAQYTAIADGPVYLSAAGGGPGERVAYQLEVSVDRVTCPDDVFEPNNSLDAAPTLGLQTATDLTLCPGDEDWYRIEVDANDAIIITLEFSHQYGDIDAQLLTGDGQTVLASGNSISSGESLIWVAEQAQSVSLRVRGPAGTSNSYQLEIKGTAAESLCVEDTLGFHDDPLGAFVLFQGLYDGFRVCPDHDDWYAIDLNGGELFTVAAMAENEATLNVAIFDDPAETPVTAGSPDADGLVWVEHTAAAAGRLYYRVQAEDMVATYTLLQIAEDPPGPCTDDRFEPNDTLETATPLEDPLYNVHTMLRLCGTEQDVFSIEMAPFSVLLVLTDHEYGVGYSDITVIDPEGSVVAEAIDFDYGAIIEVLAEIPGNYRIIVKPYDVISLPYDFAVLVY